MAHTAKHLVLTLAAAVFLSAVRRCRQVRRWQIQRHAALDAVKSQSYNSTPAQQAPAPSYGKAAPMARSRVRLAWA